MKRGLFLSLIVFGICLPIQARVGETLEQCVERYGSVMERRKSTIAGSEVESAVFSKSAITIIVEFHEGVAWHVIFRKPGLLLGETESILQANGSGLWSVSLKINDQDYRISLDKKKLSTVSADKKGVISEMVIMTRECAAAIRSGREVKLSKPGVSNEKKQESNPLPGF